MSVKITHAETGAVIKIKTIRKVAPCGSCGETVDRDSMWAMNTLFASPRDEKTRIRVRLCGACASKLMSDTRHMEWDNSQMRVVE